MKVSEKVDRWTPFIEASLAELFTLHSCSDECSYQRDFGDPFGLSTVPGCDRELIPYGPERRSNQFSEKTFRRLAYPLVTPSDELDQIVANLSIYGLRDQPYPRNNPKDVYFEVYQRGDRLVLSMKFQQIIGGYALAYVDRAELLAFIKAAEAACK